MRTIGVVSVGRSDYGIYLPILRKLQKMPDILLRIYASGMHLSARHGMTVKMFEQDGFEVSEYVEMPYFVDDPDGIAQTISRGVSGFSNVYRRSKPDVLLVLGDRFEMFSAVLAALPFGIPVAHIHGGELTQGAIDDSIRHSITKMSHVHFVATEEYAHRVRQLGEESWRVIVSGAPALDHLSEMEFMTLDELRTTYRLPCENLILLVTYHPVTLEYEQAEWQIGQVLAALESLDLPVVFTAPNADTNNAAIRSMIERYVAEHPSSLLIENFGVRGYFSMMKHCVAMVGNSSSGIIEAPSFRLPVVNIGTRQTGRVRASNVVDVGYDSAEIQEGLVKALSSEFRSELTEVVNPYVHGNAADIIVGFLKNIPLDPTLTLKKFVDLS